VEIGAEWRERVRAEMPELPESRRARYIAAGLPSKDVRQLLDEPPLCAFLDQCATAAGGDPARATVAAAKLLLNSGLKYANERGVALAGAGISPAQLAGILALRESGDLPAQSVDALFAELCAGDGDAREVAQRMGLLAVQDDGQLIAWVDAAIAANAQAADDVRAGKMAAIGRLVGAVMKQAGGAVDGKRAQACILSRLGKGGS
jgi:aspartyl-tRNA(Asn)/glutamyl-tRNA(Gln) amidotransferase subunit B